LTVETTTTAMTATTTVITTTTPVDEASGKSNDNEESSNKNDQSSGPSNDNKEIPTTEPEIDASPTAAPDTAEPEGVASRDQEEGATTTTTLASTVDVSDQHVGKTEEQTLQHTGATEVLAEDASSEAARLKAEEEARVKAEEQVRLKAEEEERLKVEQEARLKAEEEEARLKAEEEERLKVEEEARFKAEEEARLKVMKEAEEEARLKTEEEARLKAIEEARVKAEQEARLKAEKEARRKAEEERIKAAEEYQARFSQMVADAVEEKVIQLSAALSMNDSPLNGSYEVGTLSTPDLPYVDSLFVGEFMAQTARSVIALGIDTVVMCYSDSQGGSCRAASAVDRSSTPQSAQDVHLLPPLPWGDPQVFHSGKTGRLEAQRLDNKTFVVCFERVEGDAVACSAGRLQDTGNALHPFGAHQELGIGRLVSVSSASAGRQMVACHRLLAQQDGTSSCRWGDISADASDGVELQWDGLEPSSVGAWAGLGHLSVGTA